MRRHFLTEAFRDHAHRMFRGGVDGGGRKDQMPRDRGDVDHLTRFLRDHLRQYGGDAIEDPFDVDVDQQEKIRHVHREFSDRDSHHQPEINWA